MNYHKSGYILLNRCVHSVIDDNTGPVASADVAKAAPPAGEANQIPAG